MKVTLLGTSGGIPLPGRAQAGVLIESSKKKLLLDCGMGVPLRLAEAGIDAEDIDIICITHGHLDHIQDLPSLTKASWLNVGKADYEMIVPLNLKEKLIRFWRSLDEYERTDLDFKILKPGDHFKEKLNIRPFKTNHTVSSQGYHITDGEVNIVYTGDTTPCREVKDVSKNSDILIHELSLLEESELHTSPHSLISEINDIEVGELILTHFYPPVAEKADELAKEIGQKTGIPTKAGEDLQEYKL